MTVTEGVLRDLIREDGRKIQSIMQFLKSRGLFKTLAQLENETETQFHSTSLEEGSVLDEALDLYWSKNNVVSPSEQTTPISTLPIPGICATEITQVFHEVHGSANPTALAWHPHLDNILVTGGADRRLIFRDIREGNQLGEVSLASPVLSMEWNYDKLFVGCMGGELYSLTVNETVAEYVPQLLGRPHGSKRITNIRGSTNGEFIATVAKDSCVHFTGGQSVPPIRCQRDVASVCWIDSSKIVVAEIDNPLLTVWGLVDGKWKPEYELCMNLSLMDPRTAYTSLTMAWNAEYNLLATCTSRNSVLLFKIPDVCPIKTLYGMSVGTYDNPSIEFSQDGSYLYIASELRVMVFEVRSGHNVFDIPVSKSKSIRCMRRHPASDLLATVSFDHRLSVLV